MATELSSPEARETAGAKIISWYDSTNPRFVDLVGDYAGQELFLVEGDGLLREAFGDERLDFSSGFQILHAVYLVERFLQAMLTRRCNFHLAFFDDHKLLCVPNRCTEDIKNRFLLCRAIIIRHFFDRMTEQYPGVKILKFASITDNLFETYMDTAGLHFVMLNDGALASNLQVVDGAQRFDKESLRSIIAWFNNKHLNVALVNRIEIRDTKVFTMITGSRETSINLEILLPKLEVPSSSVDSSIVQKWFAASNAIDDPSERLHLAACTISALLSEDRVDPSLASAFLLHVILMKHLKLAQRGLASILFDDKLEAKIQKLLSESSFFAAQLISDSFWKQAVQDRHLEFDLVDLFDGRLFKAAFSALLAKVDLPAILKDDYAKVQAVVESVSGRKIPLVAEDSPGEIAEVEEASDVNGQQLSVLPFTNKVFEKHLSIIKISTEGHGDLRKGRIFRETTHWHNRKPIVQKKILVVKPSRRRYNPLRMNQFYMAEMTAYAASLTGASGKVLTPEIIIVGPRAVAISSIENGDVEEPEESSSKGKKADGGATKNKTEPKKTPNKKPVALSKADMIRAANTAKKAGSESDKAFASWQTIMKGFNEITNDQQRYLRAKTYLAGLDAKFALITPDVLLFELQCLLSWWAQYCQMGKASGYHVVALIWTVVRSFPSAYTTKEIAGHVEKICNLIGIPTAAHDIKGFAAPDRKLTFTFKYPNVKAPTLRIELSETEFQLLHCGPYMDRSTDGKADARVATKNWVPDGWQRKVLDEIDANRSIFVVAPTSAGKTFISFYAMEQVLRADDSSILVYIAPTKALVNQIAAEIQAQFRKNYPQAGKSVWAIHTRDYRINNPGTCQILVTVPHILQIMLLAPSNAKSWSTRIKRLVLDEIHSIGQADDGVVWEQLLLLAPCPIIALSATVGNPEQFRDWIASTQKARGIDVTLIQHHTRYSDLRKYTYAPPEFSDFKGLGTAPELGCALGLDGLSGLTFIHPIACLIDKSRGMPADLSLEPRDCFTLYKAMVKFANDRFPVPGNLAPEKALPPIIKKADTFKWEKDLKVLLKRWMGDNDSPFDKVVEELSPKEQDSYLSASERKQIGLSAEPSGLDFEDYQDSHDLGNGSGVEGKHRLDPSNVLETTLPLLVQLHRRHALPAILFNYDRSGCEVIAQTLYEQLTAAEDDFKANNPAWKKTLMQYEKHLEQKSRKSRKPPPKVSKKKGDKDDDGGGGKDSGIPDDGGSSFFDLFNPDDPLDDYSFADKKKCQRSELSVFVRQLRYKNVSENLIDLLYRGIGVHHSGMSRRYRQIVEVLFRKAYLKVVVATGTLSLGINMPCATVVFAGDSVFLNALTMRQSAGRSGRRGFDLLGNVVYHTISRKRTFRLLSSRLPDLTGHFPITTSLVLRLCTLLHESKSAPYAVSAIDSLLSQPRMYLGGESFKEQVLHHLRFSIEYLRRQGLLGPNGEPVNLTSCVSHLYFTENSAFAFHALLKSGYFTSLCADIDTRPSSVLRILMLVMSHLFGRKGCREVDDEEQAEKIRRSPSMVYLEPLPEEAAAALRAHNQETLSIFSAYTKTFAEQHLKDAEEDLPLTKIKVGAISTEINDFGWLRPLPTPVSRSAFVALSGHGDKFKSIPDLCTSTRAGIFLEQAVVPAVEFDETRTRMNAYLLDFFMHGSVKPLEEANGIRKSDVWFDLNDFSLVLATISTSLGNYLGLGLDPDMDQLDVMGSGDIIENAQDEEHAEAAVGTITNQVAESTPAATPIRKKVAANWEAAEDALASDALNESELASPEDDNEEYAKLMNVYKAFQMLKTEFDFKFREIWA